MLSLLVGADTPWSGVFESPLAVEVATSIWRNIGATLQLTFLADVLAFLSWNSYWVYQYFTKLNMLQFGLFSSLWKLFLGKKNNVLRKRVDSCEYDVSQVRIDHERIGFSVWFEAHALMFLERCAVTRCSSCSARCCSRSCSSS